jgi:PAS domain S-box-containing protein
MGHVFEFVANSTDGVIAVDHRQQIVLWNEAATAILGFSSEEALGAMCYEILRGRDGEGCSVCRRDCDAIIAARRLELTPANEMAAQTKQDREVWLNVSTILVPSRRQELSVLVCLFRDVTRQHEVAGAASDLADVVLGQVTRSPGQACRPAAPSATCVELTPREREILGHLMTGLSSQAIAELLSISSRTVRNHVNSILGKLGVHSRLEAVAYSLQNGVIESQITSTASTATRFPRSASTLIDHIR